MTIRVVTEAHPDCPNVPNCELIRCIDDADDRVLWESHGDSTSATAAERVGPHQPPTPAEDNDALTRRLAALQARVEALEAGNRP